MSGVRDFHSDLATGQRYERDPRIAQALALLHPGAGLSVAPSTMQKYGSDLILHDSETDRLYRVEVKARQAPWNGQDIVLEVISSNAPFTYGWALTTRADYIAVLYRNAVLVFHGPALVATTRQHYQDWLEYAQQQQSGFRLIETKTRGQGGRTFGSIALVVPIEKLQGPLLLVHRLQPQPA